MQFFLLLVPVCCAIVKDLATDGGVGSHEELKRRLPQQ